jgi:hypothetical protein
MIEEKYIYTFKSKKNIGFIFIIGLVIFFLGILSCISSEYNEENLYDFN